VKKTLIWILIFTLIIGGIVGVYFWRQSTNYLVTGNARVTTHLIPIVPAGTGRLERFTIFEGRYVAEDEIIGRVQNGGHLRSPVDGVVVHINAVQNQVVTPHEAVAVIADINNVHIQANIEETRLANLRVGQRAYVSIDVLGNRQFAGYISQIGWVTDAALSGNMTSFTTGGTFTRVTQLIPIQIRVTDDVYLNNLIGVNATVRIPLR
jgi:multidrug resistance efflux pump